MKSRNPNSGNVPYNYDDSGDGNDDVIDDKMIHYTFFFYKNFGSAPSTKSFLISHENFAIIVLKVF